MRIVDLGLIGHQAALDRQLAAHAEVLAGGEASVFLLEHPPVVTLGRSGGAEFLGLPPEVLAARGVELVQTTRGGKITCHFPGQLVVYPVVRLPAGPHALRRVVTALEEAALDACAAFGVHGVRDPERPGLWVGGRKIASVGLAVRRGVTYHGLALNVGPDVSLFAAMTLCGLPGVRPTSIALERGDELITVDEVKRVIGQALRETLAHPALAAGQAAG